MKGPSALDECVVGQYLLQEAGRRPRRRQRTTDEDGSLDRRFENLAKCELWAVISEFFNVKESGVQLPTFSLPL